MYKLLAYEWKFQKLYDSYETVQTPEYCKSPGSGEYLFLISFYIFHNLLCMDDG